MNRFYVFILALFTQVSIFAQCVPDASLPNDVFGLFPAPENPTTNPDGGITEPACIGKPYEFVFTLVTVIDVKGTPFGDLKVDSIVLNFVDGLPEGLTYGCNTPGCNVKGGTKGCLFIQGTPTANNEPGDYQLILEGTVYAKDTRNRPVTIPASFPDEVNFPGDIYILELRDASCVPTNCALTVTSSVKNASCFTANNGEASVQAQNGQGRVTYKWDAAAGGQATATAVGLKAGTYKVTVTDAEGCSIVSEVSVGSGLGSVNLAITKNSDSSCETGGSATVAVTNPNANSTYAYKWSNNATEATANNLAPGNYSVTVSATPGSCFGTAAVVIGGQGNTLEANVTKQDVNCNGGSGGAAEVNITGGNTGATFLWSTNAVTRQISGLAVGTYTVTITKSGCSVVKTVQINQPAPVTGTIAKTDANCSTGLGTATVTAQGGNGGYTYKWSNNQTTATINNLQPGTYTVTITDSKNCTGTQSVTIGGTGGTYTVAANSTNITCNGQNNGSASVSVTGGTGITYKWSNGKTDASINNLTAGNYIVTISDATNCTSTREFTITQPAAIVIPITKTDASCDRTTLGSATANATGGTGNLTYRWSNSQNGKTINNLQPGSYTVTVTDANNCTMMQSVTILATGTVNITPEVISVTCPGGMDGAAQARVAGSNNTFIWSTGATTPAITGLKAGDYIVTVTDAGGCSSSRTITVPQPAPIVANITKTDVSCDGSTLGMIVTAPTGGNGNYSYAWSNSKTTASITGLSPGSYMVTITDAKECRKTETVQIAGPASALVATATATEVSCNGTSTGSATVAASGGFGNYTYRWSNDKTGATISNLAAGTYQVTVSDVGGCTKTASVVVNQPAAITIAQTKQNISCKGATDGRATITPTGGKTPYRYTWSVAGAGTAATATTLPEGTHTVTITDANNCTKVETIVIGSPTALVANISAVTNECSSGAATSLRAAASGGTAPYTYLWSNNATTSTIANLTQQNYTVTITDSKGCTATKSFNVTSVANVLSATVESVTNVTCGGDKNGTAEVLALGGSGSYNFTWSVQGAANSPKISGLSGGTYKVTVADTNGSCTEILTIEIEEPDSLKVAIEATNVSCNGLSDGTLSAKVTGGNDGIIYKWSNEATSQSLAGLKAGTFQVTVTDEKGCKDTDELRLLEPEILVATIEGRGATDCQNALPTSLVVGLTGGNGGFTYKWSNNATTSSITNIQTGTYAVTVTDRRNCTTMDTIKVDGNTNAFAASISSQQNITCPGGRDGKATIQAAGGTGSYNYTWSVTGVGNVASASNLPAGTHTVTVSDGTSGACTKVLTITLTQPNPIQTTITKTDIKCGGETNGTATVVASGGNSAFTYRWSNTMTTATINNLAQGQYIVTVTDGKGCTTLDTVAIVAPTAITVNIQATGGATCANSLPSSLQAVATGGTGTYTYRWSNNATTSTIQNPAAGNIVVTVTDGNGCTKTASINVAAGNSSLQVAVNKTDISCKGRTDGAITLAPTGGTGAYTYDWRPSLPNAGNTATVSNLRAGDYRVIVKDAGDCLDTISVNIKEPALLEASNVAVGASCFGLSDGRATVTVIGGTSAYTYRWSPNITTTNSASGLKAGTYAVTATDARGCTVTQNINVTQPSEIVTTTTPIGAGCSGNLPNRVIAQATGGKKPFAYRWSNGSILDTLKNPPLGDYTLIVTDSLNCKDTVAVKVSNDIVPLQLKVEKTDVTCDADADGTATIVVTGGAGLGYKYKWSNNAITDKITGLAKGDYQVTVTDDTGCRDSIKITIADPGKFRASISNTSVTCPGAADGTVTVTPNRGVLTDYTYQWSNSSSSSFLSGLSGGAYSVTITETATNCVVTASTNIAEADSIKIELERVTNLKCNGDANGAIDIRATGGQGTLKYSWSNGPLQQDLNNIRGGTYTVTVSDGNNCKQTLDVIVNEPQPLTVTIDVANTQGRLTANVSGGTPPYTYLWLNGGGASVGTAQTISNLSAGIYTVQVNDNNRCNILRSSAIETPSCTGAFEVKLTAKNTDCNGTGGEITTEITGGNAPFRYKWSTPNADTTETVTGLAPGEYFVTVTDENGCPKIQTVRIFNPGAFTISFTGRKEIKCAGTATGGVTASPNGSGPFKYEWSNGDTTKIIANVIAGTYAVTVTNGLGCMSSSAIDLEEPDTLFAKITNRTNVTCFGEKNGTTAVIAEGGTAPYTYKWSNNANSATTTTVSGLNAGIYLVTATDVNNCITSTSVTITEPSKLESAGLPTAVSCFGVENGSARLLVSGGTKPYIYQWSNSRRDSTANNLPAGDYRITITDFQNCKDTVLVKVESPEEVMVNVTSTNETAPNANDGTAQAIPSGGTPPYQFLWENGARTQRATGLAPGNQSVTVTDSKGCAKVGTVRINEASCTVSVQATATNVTCNGEATGSARAQVSNSGNEAVTYTWSNQQNGATITGLRAGTYTVTVEQGGTGCNATASVTITQPDPISASISNKQDIGCAGGLGSATVSASGGTGTLAYLWSTGAATATATNLVAGVNTVTITDRNGCRRVETVNITQKTGITAQLGTVSNVKCAGESTGSATVNVSGGNGTYTYRWTNNLSTTATANQLPAGNYMVTVSDADGCEATVQVNITQPTALTATATVNSNATCNGESNGSATVNVTGGTPAYTYLWSNDATIAQVTTLRAGEQNITITDANGCKTSTKVTITEPTALTTTITTSNETAAGRKDGSVRAEPTGGTSPYRYNWGAAGTTRAINNLAPGKYNLTVTDANGCTTTAMTTIQEGGVNCTTFTVAVTNTPTTCSNTADGRAEVTNVGGTGPYQYLWSNGDKTAVADSLGAGTYTVTVTAADGCPSQQTVTITKPSVLEFSVKTEDTDCEGSNDGRAIVEAAGGTGPYTFQWRDGQGGNLRDTLSSGDYIVTVTDANQCKVFADFTIQTSTDRTPPTAKARDLTVYIDAVGLAEIDVEDINAESSDNCDLASVTLSKRTFTCENIGLNQVTLLAIDRAGNRDSIIANITVLDSIKPFLDCQQDDILITNCEADRTITFSLPQAFDNCGTPLTPILMEGLPSGSVFPPGVTKQVFQVKDAADNLATCSFQVNIQVLSVGIEKDEPSCFNFADGSLTASVINSSGQVFYSWSNNKQTKSITGLRAGKYTVTVIDGQGCTRIESVDLGQPTLLTVAIDSTMNPRREPGDGAIFASVMGGVPPYTYQWLKFQGTSSEILQNVEDLKDLGKGSYRLTVIDDNGCSVVSEEIVLDVVDAENTISESDILVRPNPTSGSLFIQLPQDVVRTYDAALYDVTGRLVKNIAQQQWNSGGLEIDLSKYDGGVYFLKIQVEQQILTKRVVLIKE